jgi:uncharacterized protein YbjT (DUF2867 family)
MPDARLFAPRGSDKLSPLLVDFDHLQRHSASFQEVSQVFICLGTTLADAGSREAFRKVDLDYVLAVARLGAEAGAADLLIVTALGASAGSRFFYSRVKGEVEERAAALPYRSITFFRPSLLVGAREAARLGERAGAMIGGLLRPVLIGRLSRYRPVHAEDVARAMVAVARAPRAGARAVESEEIARLARSIGE